MIQAVFDTFVSEFVSSLLLATMRGNMAFTIRQIEAFAKGKLSDPTRTGLAIEATQRGKVWRYSRRVAGSGVLVRQTLGGWPVYDIEAARAWADGLNQQVEAGIDPRAIVEPEPVALTVADAHALYIVAVERGDRRALKARTIADKRIIWDRDICPHIGMKRLNSVTSDDLWDMVEAKGRKAPVRANRLAAETKVFFKWCAGREGHRAGIRLAIDPALSLNGKHYVESKGRTRFLSDDEIGWFLSAVAGETGRAGDSYRRGYLLMLLTGARIGEVRGAEMAEYREGVWTIPAARSKNGEAHAVRPGPWGRSLMEGQGKWMIPNRTGGTIDSEYWYKVRDRIHARMERHAGCKIQPWTPHDLRRTMRSNTRSLGIDFETAEAMMNHARTGLERRYDVSDLSADMAAGWLLWEYKLADIARRVGVADALGISAASCRHDFPAS